MDIAMMKKGELEMALAVPMMVRKSEAIKVDPPGTLGKPIMAYQVFFEAVLEANELSQLMAQVEGHTVMMMVKVKTPEVGQ